jgi:hypothetical protein
VLASSPPTGRQYSDAFLEDGRPADWQETETITVREIDGQVVATEPDGTDWLLVPAEDPLNEGQVCI